MPVSAKFVFKCQWLSDHRVKLKTLTKTNDSTSQQSFNNHLPLVDLFYPQSQQDIFPAFFILSFI
jgi:hypothetical protein